LFFHPIKKTFLRGTSDAVCIDGDNS
jgi:hypothetical protein